jgi:hypothetical protein
VIADHLRAADDLPEPADPEAFAEFVVVLLNGLAARSRRGAPRTTPRSRRHRAAGLA